MHKLLALMVPLIACAVTLVGCSSTPVVVHNTSQGNDGYLGAYIPDGYPMPDVTLTDAHGQAFNLRTSPSKPVTLVFFGYTNCPDVCPGVLSDVATALQRVDPASRDKIQLVWVSTDPARDKPAVIGPYLERFDPSFIGLTGKIGDIKTAASALGVDIEGEKKLPGGGYEVGHSAQVIGFGSDRVGHVVWTPSTPIGDLKHDFALLVSRQ